jgi:lysozyme family protein
VTRDEIIAFVINSIEGGYVDKPDDPGGATNFGITQRYLNMARSAMPSMNLPANVIDLTPLQATVLYQSDEWVAVKGDQLPPPLALLVFDTAVNEGVQRAARVLQQALGVTADGLIGPATIAAAASADAKVCAEFAARRAVCYAQLDATEGQFELGWMRRLIKVYTQAVMP